MDTEPENQNQSPTSSVAAPSMPESVPPQMPLERAPQAMPPAQLNGVSQDDRTTGMLVHLLALLTGIIGVLIIWLVKKDQSRFVDHHGKDALNFQLTLMLVSFSMIAVGLLTLGVGLIVAIPLLWVIGIAAFVVEIMACLAANRGEWYTYPMTIRFIK